MEFWVIGLIWLDVLIKTNAVINLSSMNIKFHNKTATV